MLTLLASNSCMSEFAVVCIIVGVLLGCDTGASPLSKYDYVQDWMKRRAFFLHDQFEMLYGGELRVICTVFKLYIIATVPRRLQGFMVRSRNRMNIAVELL